MMASNGFRASSGGTVLLLGLLVMFQMSAVSFAMGGIQAPPCEISPGQNALRADQDQERGTHTISGELLSSDGDYFVVKDNSGKEVSLLTDKRTDKSVLEKGNRITAYVDDENYALWIRSNESTDRRSEHGSLDCNPG